MASRHIAAVADLATGNPTRKAILFAIAQACDHAGRLTCARADLQRWSAASPRSLRTHLAALKREGMLTEGERGQLSLLLP